MASERSDRENLEWIDAIKGAALWWVALNHVVERTMGTPLAANPTGDWPPIAARIDQLRPLRRGPWTIPFNAVRYAGWAGDRAVGVFLILSGFGLAYGAKPAPLDVRAYYRRRIRRVYPLWAAVHAAFAGAKLVTGTGASTRDWRFYASLAGMRALPSTMYWFAPAWWYVGAQLQLYALYPALDAAARRYGEPAVAAAACLTGWTALAAVGPRLHAYRDPWYRGAVAITRLPEFGVGMALGRAFRDRSERAGAALRSPRAVGAAMLASAASDALSVTLRGMCIAPSLASASSFVLGFVLLARPGTTGPVRRFLVWSGRHSYALFLVHHPFIETFVPRAGGAKRRIVGIGLAAAATLTGGPLLEAAVNGAERSPRRALRAGTCAAAGGAAVLAAAEAAVRRRDPQEVLGWGERPSLEPHDRFGWRLRPGRRTRLRWESYDYVVDSNAQGFPGPYPAEARAPGVRRILTLGDAYTSAEGVDTPLAWPRLLEGELAAGGPVEVVNFAVTGYGPEQYAAVAAEYVPRLRPDLVLIGMSVVDFADALTSNESFRRSIGFARPLPDGLAGFVRLLHLRRWIDVRVKEPLAERLRGTPSSRGLFLGNFAGLERGAAEMEVAAERTRSWYAQIRDLAHAAGGRLAIALVPAPVQVCGPRELAYYPRGIELADDSRFDLERPQRLTARIAADLGVPFADLREALRVEGGRSPYQRGNMHLTELGHRQVAAHLARWIEGGGFATGGKKSALSG